MTALSEDDDGGLKGMPRSALIQSQSGHQGLSRGHRWRPELTERWTLMGSGHLLVSSSGTLSSEG